MDDQSPFSFICNVNENSNDNLAQVIMFFFCLNELMNFEKKREKDINFNHQECGCLCHNNNNDDDEIIN